MYVLGTSVFFFHPVCSRILESLKLNRKIEPNCILDSYALLTCNKDTWERFQGDFLRRHIARWIPITMSRVRKKSGELVHSSTTFFFWVSGVSFATKLKIPSRWCKSNLLTWLETCVKLSRLLNINNVVLLCGRGIRKILLTRKIFSEFN